MSFKEGRILLIEGIRKIEKEREQIERIFFYRDLRVKKALGGDLFGC